MGGRNLHGKSCKCTPGRAKSPISMDIFAGQWRVGGVNLAVLACVLRATTKIGRQLYRGKKWTPRENPGYAYVSMNTVYIACVQIEQQRWQRNTVYNTHSPLCDVSINCYVIIQF